MPVLKNKIEKNFVVVPRAFLMDRTLRLKERGLVATLLSLPDNWNFTVKGLATITGDGKESIYKSIKILVDKGYLIKGQERDSNGKFSNNYIEVCPEGKSLPFPENPISGKPIPGKPVPEKQSQYNNNKLNNKELNNKEYTGGDKNAREWTEEERHLYGV